MKRLGTLFKYVMWLVIFFVFSEFIINVGLNSSYRDMKKKGNIPSEVNIEYAEATKVNGKIKGTIQNTSDDYLTGKYLKMDFYSNRNNLLGTKYIPIQTTEANRTQEFEAFFELQDVSWYDVSIVESKDTEEIELIPKEMKKSEIILTTIWVLLIFW